MKYQEVDVYFYTDPAIFLCRPLFLVSVQLSQPSANQLKKIEDQKKKFEEEKEEFKRQTEAAAAKKIQEQQRRTEADMVTMMKQSKDERRANETEMSNRIQELEAEIKQMRTTEDIVVRII